MFFTNVDITGPDRAELKAYAQTYHVSFVDIYWRERIRVELDSTRGIMYRLKYLDIPMTIEDQQAFFAEFGEQIEGLVHERFDAVDSQLRRLCFEMDCLKPLRMLRFGFTFDREYSTKELGAFRFLFGIENYTMSSSAPALWIGGRDPYWGSPAQGDVGVQMLVWARDPDEKIDLSAGHSWGQSSAHMFVTFEVRGRGPYKKLGDLQHCSLSVWVSEPLCAHIAGVFLIANDYGIINVDAGYLECHKMNPFCEWPEELRPSIEELPWVLLTGKGSRSILGMFGGIWNPWDLSFTHYTPEQIKMPEGSKLSSGMNVL